MAEPVRLDSLTGTLPRVADQFIAEADTELRRIYQEDPLFIPPQLREILPVKSGTSIVLIEAQAAMGKSMLARHVAWATCGLYWDMSEIHVGHGTLYGRLAQTFGMNSLGGIIARLMNGEMLLVIDALDEAELRAAGPAFDAFLDDLKQLVVTPRKKPTVMILGRSDTIEYMSIALGRSVPAARFALETFDEPSAFEFIDVRLDEHTATPGMTGQHRRHRVVYERARSLLLKVLERSLVSDSRYWSWDELSPPEINWQSDRVRSFLGYAPVLESLSNYLAADSTLTRSRAENFYNRMITECLGILREPALGTSSHWDLLSKMVRDLLVREQGKFLKQARELVAATPTASWDLLYTPEEQLLQILCRMAGISTETFLPNGFPESALTVYHSLLQTAVPNHPFIGSGSAFANVVMRDYTYAWALSSQSQPGLANYARRSMQDDSYLPTPMFGRFYIGMTAAANSLPDCAASDVGFVYESLVAEYTVDERPLLSIGNGEEDAGLFVLGGKSMDEGLVLSIKEPNRGIQLWRRLSNARIVGDMPVRMGQGSSFTIGPDVHIDCSLLEVPVSLLRVQKAPDSKVEIIASVGYLIDSSSSGLLIRVYDEGSFGVFWENIRYPWVQFAIDRPNIDIDERRLMQSFIYFCRTIAYFGDVRRRLGIGAGRIQSDWIATRSVDTLYRYGYGRGALSGANQLYSFLIDKGLLSIHGDEVSLDFQWLQERGISKRDLYQRRLTPQIRELLEAFERQRDN